MSYEDDLKAYLDGELPPEHAARVEERLRTDPLLRAEAEELRLLSDQIRAMARQPHVVGEEEVLRSLRARAPSRSGFWTKSFALGAASLIIAVFAVQIVRHPEALDRFEDRTRTAAEGGSPSNDAKPRADRAAKESEEARAADRDSTPDNQRPARAAEADVAPPPELEHQDSAPSRPLSNPQPRSTKKAPKPGAEPRSEAQRQNQASGASQGKTPAGQASQPTSDTGFAGPTDEMTPKAAAPGGVGGGGGAGRGPDRPTAADLGGPAAQSRSGPRVIAQTIEVEIASEDLAAAKGRLANLVRALGLVAERARSADAEARSDRLAFRVPHELVREFTAKLDLVGTIMKQTTTRQDLTAEREQLDAEQRELHVQQQAAETQSGGGQRQSKNQAGGLAATQRRMSDIERRLAAIEERIGYVLVEITLVPAK
jgi:hypothetical protein